MKDKRFISLLIIIGVFLSISVIITAIIFFTDIDTKFLGIDRGRYQAVFLTNGQVYFGKLDSTRSNFVLTDIYYLQVNSNLQSQEKQDQTKKEGAESEPSFTLVQLGDELHQPESKMVINKDHVLFWENLKSDSRVVEAIQKNKSK